jgi:methionine biosynthesis protein MetW
MDYNDIRLDHKLILGMIPGKSTVLDLGCGSGELLYLLIKEKGCSGHGIEIDEQSIYNCVARGLNVLHGDIDSGLAEYSEKSFDYVILNQSLQQVKHFQPVLDHALRVGKKVIVGFPNFAYFGSRFQIFFGGKSPVTRSLPYNWYESPNVHFFSISDFLGYCSKHKIKIEGAKFIGENNIVRIFPNLFAQTGIFLISK